MFLAISASTRGTKVKIKIIIRAEVEGGMDGSFHARASGKFSKEPRALFGIDYTIKKEYNDGKT